MTVTRVLLYGGQWWQDMITSPEIQEGFLRVFHHAAKLNRLVLVSHNPKTAFVVHRGSHCLGNCTDRIFLCDRNPVDETRFERAERILQASPALHFGVFIDVLAFPFPEADCDPLLTSFRSRSRFPRKRCQLLVAVRS